MSIVLINGSHPDYLINFRGQLISDLIDRGHKVHVTSPGLGAEEIVTLQNLGAIPHSISLDRRGLNPFLDGYYIFQLRKIIKQINADYVLGYTIKPNIWGTYATIGLGVRSAIMITGLGFAFSSKNGEASMSEKIIHRLFKVATDYNEVVIFQNEDDRDDFIKAGCLLDPRKAKIVNGSGVDTDHFSVAPLPDQPVFLLIARLLISKGVREYAEAAQKVMNTRNDCRFLIAGFLDEGPDCISQDELDAWIESGIEYLGHLKDVRPAIAKASVYVLPSYREGTPRTVLEASAMGRPSIVTDAPGCRETVISGKTGYLVPPKNSQALCEAMITIAESNELRKSMGAAARDFCVEKYAVEKVNQTLIQHLGL